MIEQIKEHVDHEPFQPFRIITSSGDRYEIRDPYALAITPSYIFYCFPRTEKSVHIRLNQIVALESLEPAA